MLLWLMFAGLTAAVLAIVLRPLFRAEAATAEAAAPDLAVYKSQLAELDRQSAEGRVDAAEYAALRNEIARRILRLERTPEQPRSSAASALVPRRAGLIAAAAVPLASLVLYLLLGTPDVPAGRGTGTRDVAQASAAELIGRVEQRLEAKPDDVEGWRVIAPIYLKLGRYDDAARAYKRLIDLGGETPTSLAGLADATIMANDGIVTDAARAAYEKVAATNPELYQPRFWLALAMEQDGKRAEAAAAYRALLAAAPDDASWRPLVEGHLAAVTDTPRTLPRASETGPSETDVAAAAKMSPGQRSAMISGMVDRLAERLRADGHDAAGWEKLITSYVTLGESAKASAALASARAALAGDRVALTSLDALAGRLKVSP